MVYTYTKAAEHKLCSKRCPFRYIRVRNNLWMDIRFIELHIHLPVRHQPSRVTHCRMDIGRSIT